MECLRDCDCGSVEDLVSLEIGVSSIDGEGLRAAESTSILVGTSLDVPGEISSSGFAILKPPND